MQFADRQGHWYFPPEWLIHSIAAFPQKAGPQLHQTAKFY
jgi:hypothetical protein